MRERERDKEEREGERKGGKKEKKKAQASKHIACSGFMKSDHDKVSALKDTVLQACLLFYSHGLWTSCHV